MIMLHTRLDAAGGPSSEFMIGNLEPTRKK
jgi:hypothetical protein